MGDRKRTVPSKFKPPRAGEFFAIRARYDKGGWPAFLVLARYGKCSLIVVDCFRSGEYNPKQPQRVFKDQRGWTKLRKYWKRVNLSPDLPAHVPGIVTPEGQA